ncbi:MAG TPA: CBS domain-containing protein [Thiopseudomonas sp.]|nr:CBS domain-containing protein [Thiopseudomonas sp.]
MKASEWLKKYPFKALTISGKCSLQDAAHLLLEAPKGRDLFVLDAEGAVCGHLCFWHVATLLLSELRPTSSLREMIEQITLGSVADHMNDQVMCAELEEDIDDILHQHDFFLQHVERRAEEIPVVDEQRRLLGVIRLADLLRDAISTDD